MKQNNKLAAGLLALSLPALMLSISTPAANADGGTVVTSQVAAIDSCLWKYGGVPGSLTLLPEDMDAKYEGETLEVKSIATGLELGLTGSTADLNESSTECSFYNDIKPAEITVELDGVEFVATYLVGATPTADIPMDFEIGASNSFDFVADVDTERCSGSTWTSTPANMTSATLASLFGTSTGLVNKYVAGAAPNCSPEIAVSIDLPESDGIPAGKGRFYTFTGPTITFGMTTAP
jgi:hypothetical protein